jgi:hypothetical protein
VLDDVKKIKGAVSADDSKRFTKEVSQLGICTISLHPHLHFRPTLHL